MCIQLTICLPLPSMAAIPILIGFLNSVNAPPSLLKTMPVLNFTSRITNCCTGSILSSQSLQVSPKKSVAGLSVSTKRFCLPWLITSAPYQPIALELITAFTLLVLFCKVATNNALLCVLLSFISFL